MPPVFVIGSGPGTGMDIDRSLLDLRRVVFFEAVFLDIVRFPVPVFLMRSLVSSGGHFVLLGLLPLLLIPLPFFLNLLSFPLLGNVLPVSRVLVLGMSFEGLFFFFVLGLGLGLGDFRGQISSRVGSGLGVDSAVGDGAIVSGVGVLIGDEEPTTAVVVTGSCVGEGVRISLSVDEVGMILVNTGDGVTINVETDKVGVGSIIAMVELSAIAWVVVNDGITEDMLLVRMIVVVTREIVGARVNGVVADIEAGNDVEGRGEVVTIIGGGFNRMSSMAELISPAIEYSATSLLVNSLLLGPDLSKEDFVLLNM